MDLFFACYGGSGSTYLSRRLKSRATGKATVDERPETYWLPEYFPQQKKSATKFDQKLGPLGYAEYPTAASLRGFKKRTRFAGDPKLTIDENLVRYVEHVRSVPKRVTMFSRAPMFHFFSRNKIRPVVFVVRHPLHQYISLTRPYRHEEFVQDYGGVNSKGGVDFFITEWTRFVRDALESDNYVVRYEFMHSDIKKLTGVARSVLSKWKCNSRHYGELNPKLEQRLMKGTRELYKELYGNEWLI